MDSWEPKIAGFLLQLVHLRSGGSGRRQPSGASTELPEHTGLQPGRLHFSWISSAESTKYVEVAMEVIEAVRRLGPLRGFRKESSQALQSQN